MKFTKLNKLLVILVLSSASVGAFAEIGDTPYTLAQRNATSTTPPKLAYLAIGFSWDIAYMNPLHHPVNHTMVQVCNVEKDGNFTGCKDSGVKLDYPASYHVRADSVAVHGKYVYIANNTEGQILKCSIGADGLLSSCHNTGSRVGFGPSWISFHNNIAYIALQFMNQVYKCDIDSKGELTNCMDSGGTSFAQPTAVAFHGNHAYVTDPNLSDIVTVCSVGSDGSLSNCNNQKNMGLGRNYNLAFNNNIVYAPNASVFVGGVSCHDLIKKCTIAKDGTFENCDSSGRGTDTNGGFYQPFTMTFNNNYAYVANNSFQGSVYTPTGEITDSTRLTKCTAAKDGSLVNCEYIRGNFDGVTSIAFK